jgi:hypothetical protein
VCKAIGTSTNGGTSAVECADIYVNTPTSSGWADIWGEGEYYCQGQHPQCLGMNVENSIVVSSSTFGPPDTESSGNFKCNPNVGACPNGGRQFVGTPHVPVQENNHAAVYAFDPAGEVISINGASSASHSTSELDTQPMNLQIQFCGTPGGFACP